jgi:hypothetical protein
MKFLSPCDAIERVSARLEASTLHDDAELTSLSKLALMNSKELYKA